MKETADEAVLASPSIRHVIVYKRLGREIPWTEGRDHWWHALIGGESDVCPALPVEFDRPCLIIYTSGTTGRPKGAVLTQGGFLLKCAHDFGYLMDVGPGDRLFWLTDLGWLMGPMLITAGLPRRHGRPLRGRARLSEAEPALVARRAPQDHGHGGLAHRRARPHAARRRARARARPRLARVLGSTGEPWNPEPYRWLFENAGKARVPIINYTAGRRSPAASQLVPDRADQAVLVHRTHSGDGGRLLR